MTALDYGFIILILAVTLLSFSKGIVIELLAIIKWLASLYIAGLFYVFTADLLLTAVNPPWLRLLLAFILIFLMVYVACHFIAGNLEKGIDVLGLSSLNHFLGIFLGLVKSLIIVLALVFALTFTPITATASWQDSLLIPYLQELLRLVSPYVETWINQQLENIPRS